MPVVSELPSGLVTREDLEEVVDIAKEVMGESSVKFLIKKFRRERIVSPEEFYSQLPKKKQIRSFEMHIESPMGEVIVSVGNTHMALLVHLSEKEISIKLAKDIKSVLIRHSNRLTNFFKALYYLPIALLSVALIITLINEILLGSSLSHALLFKVIAISFVITGVMVFVFPKLVPYAYLKGGAS
ncbi:MAG: hypothetical protein ACXQS2_01030 [Methermicoccaceae archaeon]